MKVLKSKTKLIYFDEFQVTNIVDAMILGKLFEQIFKEDIKIILTSNTWQKHSFSINIFNINDIWLFDLIQTENCSYLLHTYKQRLREFDVS